MARRLSAFAFLVTIVGAPITVTVCQMTCTSHGVDASTGHAHQHSCPQSTPTTGTAMNGAPHACGHQPDDTVGVQQALQLFTAPALVGWLSPLVENVSVAHGLNVEHSPPGIITPSTQLRV